MKGEIWKDIEGYEGLYQVSNMGRVKSVERTVWNKGKGCYKTVPEKILKPRKERGGYLMVGLYKDARGKNHKIHRLVATAFLPNPNNLSQINHKNEIKTDNKVDNLEWCSVLYNLTYNDRAKKVGEKLRGRKLPKEQIKKLSKPVFSVDRESGLIMYWESIAEAEKCTGIDSSSITKCCKGKMKSCGNHYWFYADDDNE